MVEPGGGGLPVKVTVVEELGADSSAYGTRRMGSSCTSRPTPHYDHVFDTDTGAGAPE